MKRSRCKIKRREAG